VNGIADRTARGALAVARAAFEALGEHDWPELRRLVDPTALVALKQRAISVVHAAAEAGADEPAGVGSMGVGSIEELQALPPEDVFLRWMASTESSARLARATGVAHVIPPVRYVVLGVVVEDADTAHAVYRAEGFIQGVHVESLRLTSFGWRLSVDGVISRALRIHFTLGMRRAP
jgi:hypothetical protein